MKRSSRSRSSRTPSSTLPRTSLAGSSSGSCSSRPTVAPGASSRLAARGLLAPGHDPQQRRLAGAVRAEHADLRPVEERERDVREHLPVGAVELVGPVHRVDVFAHSRPPPGRVRTRTGPDTTTGLVRPGATVTPATIVTGRVAAWREGALVQWHMAVKSRRCSTRALRADFPIFEQIFHGKPLAYLELGRDLAEAAAGARRDDRVLRDVVLERPPRRLRARRARDRRARGRPREGARVRQRARPSARSSSSATRPRALNLVAYAYGLARLGPGDVVLATELEHHSNFVPWQYVANRTGAEFRIIPIDDNGDLAARRARRTSRT